MNSHQSLAILPSAEDFVRRFNTLGAEYADLARQYVLTIDARPKFKAELVAAGMNPILLDRIELFGRGCIDERFLFRTGPVESRLCRLPLSEQRRVLADGVEVLDDDEESKRLIPFDALTSSQAKLVFGPRAVRSIAEQRTLLRQQKAKALPADVPAEAFRVTKEHVVILRPVKLTKAQLLQMLQEML